MLKSKLASIAAAAALSFGVMGSAHSAVVINAGNYKITLDNFDLGTKGYGTAAGVKCTTVDECDAAAANPALSGSSYDTMGIFNVARIEDKNGNTIFSPGNPIYGGKYLTGVFGGLTDSYAEVTCSPVTGCSTTTLSTGGVWALYENNSEWDATQGSGVGVWDPASLTYPGITGGTLWLEGVFGKGLIENQPDSTYYSNFGPTLSGTGTAYLDITGGDAFDMFKPAGYTPAFTDDNGGEHDMYLTTSFDDRSGSASNLCTVPATGTVPASGCWTVKSTTQITGVISEVPEPGTMALAGLALLGAGLASRRRKS